MSYLQFLVSTEESAQRVMSGLITVCRNVEKISKSGRLLSLASKGVRRFICYRMQLNTATAFTFIAKG